MGAYDAAIAACASASPPASIRADTRVQGSAETTLDPPPVRNRGIQRFGSLARGGMARTRWPHTPRSATPQTPPAPLAGPRTRQRKRPTLHTIKLRGQALQHARCSPSAPPIAAPAPTRPADAPTGRPHLRPRPAADLEPRSPATRSSRPKHPRWHPAAQPCVAAMRPPPRAPPDRLAARLKLPRRRAPAAAPRPRRGCRAARPNVHSSVPGTVRSRMPTAALRPPASI